jgi:hypothetical protein
MLQALPARLGKAYLKLKKRPLLIRLILRFRPETALTRFQSAELQLEHYPDEKSEAVEHLNFAIDELREMKMQPSLEKAEALKEKYGLQ